MIPRKFYNKGVIIVLILLGFIAFPYVLAPILSGIPLARGNKVDSRFDTYYKNYKGIYYLSTTNPFLMMEVGVHWAYLEDVDEDSFIVFNNSWAKDATHVWNRGKVLDYIDVESFHVNVAGMPVDKNNVYVIGDCTYIPSQCGIDPATAEYFVDRLGNIETLWMRDKDHVYYDEEIMDVDRNSFVKLKTDWFIDKDFIYTMGNDTHNKRTLLRVDSVQYPIDTIAEGSDYLRNGRNVLFNHKIIVEDTDIKRLEMVSPFKCIVNDMLFDYGEQILKDELNVEAAKFYLFGHIAVDDSNVFYGRERLQDIDAPSFKQIDYDTFEDKDYIYIVKSNSIEKKYPFDKKKKSKTINLIRRILDD